MNDGADTPPAGRPRGLRRWFITGLGIGQICSWGSLYYSFPLIAEQMAAGLGWSKPELYGGASLGLLLAALAAYPVGAAIDRGYGRIVMAGGAALGGLLLLAWSQVEHLWLFYLLMGGLGVIQAATLYEPAFAVVARRMGVVNARAGITALTLWGGFASTVFIPLIQLLLDEFGWRGALAVLAGINLVICGSLYFAIIHPAADAPQPANRPDGVSPLTGRLAVTWAARRPAFWALAVAFTAYTATFSAFLFHLYPLLLERGLEVASVVAAMTVIGPAQVAGRIGIWMLARHTSVRAIGAVTVLGFPVAFTALAVLPPSFVVVAGAAALYGAANGIMTIVRGLAVPEMLTPEAYGAINGALTAPSTLAKAVAPAGAALIWAWAGSYDAVLVAIVVGSLVMVVSFWLAALLSPRDAFPATAADRRSRKAGRGAGRRRPR